MLLSPGPVYLISEHTSYVSFSIACLSVLSTSCPFPQTLSASCPYLPLTLLSPDPFCLMSVYTSHVRVSIPYQYLHFMPLSPDSLCLMPMHTTQTLSVSTSISLPFPHILSISCRYRLLVLLSPSPVCQYLHLMPLSPDRRIKPRTIDRLGYVGFRIVRQ
jgi:hypothetical protein